MDKSQDMTNEQAVKALTDLSGDPEGDHRAADDILLEWIRAHGGEDVADAYWNAGHRVGFWHA